MYNFNIAFTKDRRYVFTLPTKKVEDRRFVYVSRNAENGRHIYTKFWLEPKILIDVDVQDDIFPGPDEYEREDLDRSIFLDDEERREVKELTRTHRGRLVSQWNKFYGEGGEEKKGTDIDLIHL